MRFIGRQGEELVKVAMENKKGGKERNLIFELKTKKMKEKEPKN